MKSPLCPYLGFRDDAKTALGFPSEGNYCHGVSPAAPVKLEHQQNTCLSATYNRCPIFVVPFKEPGYYGARSPLEKPPQTSLVKVAGMAAAVLLVVLLALAAWYFFSGAGENPGMAGPAETSTPTRTLAAGLPATLADIAASPTVTRTPFKPVANQVLATHTPLATRCETPVGWVPYTVKPTDSLIRLSRVFGVSVAELQRANCLGERTVLQSGEKILVPLPATATQTHTPAPTDTPRPQATSQPRPTRTAAAPPPPNPLPQPTNTSAPTEEPTSPPPPTALPPTTAPPPTSTPAPTETPLLTPTSPPDSAAPALAPNGSTSSQ